MKEYLLLLVLEQLSANFTYCSIFFSFFCRGELQALLVVILGKKKENMQYKSSSAVSPVLFKNMPMCGQNKSRHDRRKIHTMEVQC